MKRWRVHRALSARMRCVKSGDDAGFSLVELLTVMLVFGIVVSAVGMMVFTATRTVQVTSTRLDETNSGRVAMASVVRPLRVAVLPRQLSPSCAGCETYAAFIKGTPTEVQFFADIDNVDPLTLGPRKVRIWLDGDKLYESTQPPDAHDADNFNYTWADCTPGPTCSIHTKLLAGNVLASEPLFTYYDYDLNQIEGTVLDSNQLKDVSAIDVVIQIKKNSMTSHQPTTFMQQVPLPNVNTMVRATQEPKP